MPVLANGLFAVAARLQVRLAGVIAVEGDVPEAEEDGAETVAAATPAVVER
jgi:hypothetical protein